MARGENRQRLVSAARATLRLPWAATLIPVGLAMGVGGLIQHAVRTVRAPADPPRCGTEGSHGCAGDECPPELRGST